MTRHNLSAKKADLRVSTIYYQVLYNLQYLQVGVGSCDRRRHLTSKAPKLSPVCFISLALTAHTALLQISHDQILPQAVTSYYCRYVRIRYLPGDPGSVLPTRLRHDPRLSTLSEPSLTVSE